MDDYPTVKLILRWGGQMATAAALAPPLIAVALVADGWRWPTLLAGAIIGAAVLVLARSYVEVIRIIADTLLPK
jgi:MFS family permease